MDDLIKKELEGISQASNSFFIMDFLTDFQQNWRNRMGEGIKEVDNIQDILPISAPGQIAEMKSISKP